MFKSKVISKWEAALGFGLVITIIMSLCSFGVECSTIRSDVLRLHILANSDSREDQALKLRVRDEILKRTKDIFANADNIESATENARANIGKIEQIARSVIKAQGYKYSVSANVAKSNFTTRHYGKYTLPAGIYNAVKIVIGEGAGHNWWCVMYPSLCLPSAVDNYDSALNKSEQDVVENYNKYEIKFKAVELFEQLKEWF